MRTWKRWSAIALLGVVLSIGLALIGGMDLRPTLAGLPILGQLVPLPSGLVPRPIPATEQPLLTVEGDRLLADVTALAFERHTAGGREQAREYITQALTAAGWEVVRQSIIAEDGSFQGINLIAGRPQDISRQGASDGTALLVGAHYDTVGRSPGADDNASGVAVALEVARRFATLPITLPLRLVFFDLEEVGLVGSRAFVAALGPLEDLAGAVILEMMGFSCTEPGCQSFPEGLPIAQPSDRGDFLAVVGDMAHPALVDAFLANASSEDPLSLPIFTLKVPTLGPLAADLLRSDHVPFWERRLGAVMVTDTANFRNPHYHQPNDRPDTLDPVFLTGAAQAVVNAIASLSWHIRREGRGRSLYNTGQ
ncbi:MAG: M28 family peptidase [Synechococcales bacterium]|nr:M28 family peptidase [Synechococcales bacterium]